MRSMLLTILAFAVACPTVADDKKPAPARVVVTGKATLFLQASSVSVAIQGGEDVEKKIKEATKKVTATMFKNDAGAGLAVILPADSFPLADILKLIDNLYAVEGILTTTDHPVLITLSGNKDAKRVLALIATKVTAIDDKNKTDFPAPNHALVEGIAKKESWKFDTTAGEWSIQNADGIIPFVAPKDAKLEAGAKLRVSGPTRLLGGQLLVEADKAEAVKK